MRLKPVRDTILLTLPLLLVGGGVLWKTQGLKLTRLKKHTEPQPLRIEYSPIEEFGLLWGEHIRPSVWKGKSRLCALGDGAARMPWSQIKTGQTHLTFREGNVWSNIPLSKSAGNFACSVGLENDLAVAQFAVDLSAVPKSAEEVYLRGRFQNEGGDIASKSFNVLVKKRKG